MSARTRKAQRARRPLDPCSDRPVINLTPADGRTSVIRWIDTKDELPDDDRTVLVANVLGEVWMAYREAGIWRSTDGLELIAPVTDWAELPADPRNR